MFSTTTAPVGIRPCASSKRVRSSRKPVESFVEILSAERGISIDDFGFSKAELSFESGGQMRQCLAPLISEIKKTLHFFETELKEPISSVLLSGVGLPMFAACVLVLRGFSGHA